MELMKSESVITSEDKPVFVALYKELFPKVAQYVKKRGGSYDVAKDIFQDSMVIYYEKTRLDGSLIEDHKAYLMGIVKHLWFRRYQENNKWEYFEDIQVEIADSVDEYLKPSSNKLLRYLEKAGQKCMRLLKAFYYQKHSASEIADEFEFSGARSATVQKYKCLEKVRDIIKEKELRYADFIE